MDDLAELNIETLTLRISRRVPLVDELVELLEALADRIDDFGEHRVAVIMRDQADDFRQHARSLEILTAANRRENRPVKNRA